jgi:hypothetical protein
MINYTQFTTIAQTLEHHLRTLVPGTIYVDATLWADCDFRVHVHHSDCGDISSMPSDPDNRVSWIKSSNNQGIKHTISYHNSTQKCIYHTHWLRDLANNICDKPISENILNINLILDTMQIKLTNN